MFRLSDFRLGRRIKQAIQERRGYRIPELSMESFFLDTKEGEPRINLVMAGIKADRIFGGASTALRFFELVRKRFPRARIVVIDEHEKQFESERWPNWALENALNKKDTIAYLKDSDAPLSVEPHDYFIATYWKTARFVNMIRSATDRGHTAVGRPFIYLVQDYEPGFYPWSSLYLMAKSTYAGGASVIPVFNTKLLEDFFVESGYQFSSSYFFEPALHPVLAARRAALAGHSKKQLLLVYGRPSIARNAFELIVETLHAWSGKYENAGQWQLVSLGEKHSDILLQRSAVLRSKGKMTIEQYADYLTEASVGISLMVSPHPSYPPLEMAEFGVNVVTNRFANKDLSSRASNIISVEASSPQSLSDALVSACLNYDNGMRSKPQAAFIGGANEFPFIDEMVNQWFGAPALNSTLQQQQVRPGMDDQSEKRPNKKLESASTPRIGKS